MGIEEESKGELDFEDINERRVHREAYNMIVREAGYYDDEIYEIEELIENEEDKKKIIDRIRYGKVNWEEEYIIVNGYGNYESINYLEAQKIMKERLKEIGEEEVQDIIEQNADNYLMEQEELEDELFDLEMEELIGEIYE